MFRSVLLFLTATNIYLYLKLRSGFGKGWWNAAYVTWAVVWAVLTLTARSGYFVTGREAEVLFSVCFTRAVILGMSFAVFLCADIASLAAGLFDRLAGTKLKTKLFTPRKCVPITLLFILTIVLFSFYEAWNVRRIDIVIETSKLPEGIDRLRLVHLTDVHLGGGLYSVDRLRKIMDIIRSAEPDILVITGDLVDSRTGLLEEEAKIIASCEIKYGAYAVFGNHEFYSGLNKAADFMKRSGIILLRDARVNVGGISIIGLDERGGMGMSESGILTNSKNIPENRFILLLSHRPNRTESSEDKFDLQLSGHTHGGQIWPIRYLAQMFNKSVQHLSYKGSSAIYVSNGAGFFGPPMRFLTPPEVTVIDLKNLNHNIHDNG